MANAQMASLWFLGKVGSHSYGTSQLSAHWRSLMWPWRPGNHPLQLRWRHRTKLPSMLGSQHNRLTFPADCGGVSYSWPCQRVSCSLPHDARKENSPTDRQRARDCFFCFSVYQSWCSASIACYSTILLSTMAARIKCHSSHFPIAIFLFPNPSGSLIPRV